MQGESKAGDAQKGRREEMAENGKVKVENGEWRVLRNVPIWEEYPPPRQFCEECENTGVRAYGTWKNIWKNGGGEGSTPIPGNSYRYQNEGVTRFDCWKWLKRKGGQRG
jgi:hypothetical protein